MEPINKTKFESHHTRNVILRCGLLWIKKITTSIYIVFLLVQIFFAPSSFALDPHKSLLQYIHTTWQTEDGLPQNAVLSILQTRDGYLWLGTQEGLARFDGMKFTVFDKTNTPGINNNNFQSIIQTTDGSIWIGTQGGLTHMVGEKFVTYTKEDGLANNNVYDLYEDAQQNLWIATGGGGISVWKDGKFKNFTTKDGLAQNFVINIEGGKDGTIYIGTTGGLTKYSKGIFTTYKPTEGFANKDVLSLCFDADNILWVGTVAGLCQFKNGKWTTFTTKDGLTNDRIRSILKDRDGNLWIGTEGTGINRMRGNQFSYYSVPDGLIDGSVWTFYEDREGNMWVGTYSGGLHCFHDGKFTVYTEKEGLSQDNTRAIYETRDGSVWVGTDSRGMTRFKNGLLTVDTTTPVIDTKGSRAICEGPDGSLWIGTYGGGICRLKNGKSTIYTTKEGLANDRIFSLMMAKDSTLWIGTRGGGISILKNGKFTTYTTNEGLTNNEVRNIMQASDGSIWICTSDGLNRLKDGKIINYTTKDGLSYNIVYSIFEDENKVIWIGTYGGGLNRFKDGRFTVFTTKQGMYDNTVFQILEDGQEYFWLTCNKGIYRVSKKELNDYADGKIQTVHCTVFGTADGLRNTKCNGSCQPAGIRTRDGKLWIPTMKGVAIVDPAKLAQSKIPLPVFIERALFDKKEVPFDSVIQAGPGQGELEIHYTALSYAEPKLLRFKYMLVGFNKEWINAGTRRIAYYTNLSPGNYTFKTIACNNDGVWNLNGATIRVTVAAYFYQTIWFRGFMTIAIIMLGFGAYRLRILNLRKRERELVQIVDDRTKNLQQEIGERKRTEVELQIYSSRYEAMLASIPDIIMEVDNDKFYRWANRAGKDFFGEDVVGKEAVFYFAGEQETYNVVRPLFLGNENVIYVESWQRRKDGEKRLLAWWCHVLKDEKGNVTGALSTARDITQQKNAEKAVRESEAKYREMVEQINDVIFATDLHGNFTYISPAAEFLAGYRPEEIIGRSLAEFIDPEYIPKMKEQFQKILSGKLEPFEYRIKVKSGELRWMRSSSKPILEGTTPVGLRGVLTDITARKQAEEVLNLFSHSVKSISECVSITDLNNKIIFVNQAFQKTYGYSEEELVGKSISLVRTDTKHSEDIVLKKTLQGGWQGEIFNRKKDGTVFSISLSTSVVYDEQKQPIALVGVAIDITERKRSEETLAQERNLLRTLIDNMPDRIYAKDAEGRFTICNKALATRMGMSSPDEIVGKSDFDFVSHELAERFRADELVIIQSGQPLINREEPMDSVTGITRWNLATKVPLRDNHGNIIGIVGMGRDITERKRAEEALKESEKRFREMFDDAPVGYHELDVEGRFTRVNKTELEMLGYTAEEMIDQYAWKFVADQELSRQRILAKLAGTLPPSQSAERFYLRKDDTKLPVLMEDRLLRDINGKITGIRTIIQNLTERKQAEEAQREIEERYQRLVEFSPDAIAVHIDGKFVYINPTAIKLLGAKDASELIGRPFLDIVHPDYKEIVRQRISAGLEESKALPTMEEKFIRLDGGIVDVAVTSLPIILKGKPAMQVVANDITEQKKLRLELVQSQKMQSIGTLAGGIAHDFNNILGIILGYTGLIEKRKLDDPKLIEGISVINQTVQRGAALVRQILTFARKTDIAFEPMDTIELIHEILSMLKQTFPKVITFIEIFNKDIPYISADRTQIHQAILNLCVNARDAMPNGGTITIKVEKQSKERVQERFPAANQDLYVCISVIDTGEGMDDATRLRVFDPFFTTKPMGQGTGMGLSVVYGVVQAHQGFIDLESRLGRGTTFRLYFPAPTISERVVESQQSVEPFEIGGKETILLVEDEEFLLDLVRLMLESKGYTIHSAKDGIEAIEQYMLHKEEISLVFTDMGLPGLTGIDQFKRLKEINPNIKVIFASGFFDPDIKSELLIAGATGFIQKPYTTDDVLRKLREVLDKK